MKPIDQLLTSLKSALPGVQIRQLQPALPADDAGLWFITHPDSNVEINVESHDGDFPFLIENSRNDTRVTTADLAETITALRWTLGRYQTQGTSVA
jgi:hypothetical protein